MPCPFHLQEATGRCSLPTCLSSLALRTLLVSQPRHAKPAAAKHWVGNVPAGGLFVVDGYCRRQQQPARGDPTPCAPALPCPAAANYTLMQLAPALGSFGLAMTLAGTLYEVSQLSSTLLAPTTHTGAGLWCHRLPVG